MCHARSLHAALGTLELTYTHQYHPIISQRSACAHATLSIVNLANAR